MEFLGLDEEFLKDYEYLQEVINLASDSEPHLKELIRLWNDARKRLGFYTEFIGWEYINNYLEKIP